MIEKLARLGYASKALIYAIVGYLLLAVAFNRGGRITDTSGALRVVLGQPFGRFLLILLAVGLCGYALWRILDAISDPDRHGTSFKGIVTRIGNAVRAVIYGALGYEAFRLFQGLGGSNGREAEMWTARFLQFPLGEWLVALAGAIVAIYGVSEIIAAFKGGYSATLDLSPIAPQFRRTAENISRIGIGSRGVLITILGIFLVRAGLQRDPSEAHGTRESILELANAVPGKWAFVFMGIGLLAYAFDQAIHARCRRIRPVL
jgi:Domain of Unknown Function (DUF1206)